MSAGSRACDRPGRGGAAGGGGKIAAQISIQAMRVLRVIQTA